MRETRKLPPFLSPFFLELRFPLSFFHVPVSPAIVIIIPFLLLLSLSSLLLLPFAVVFCRTFLHPDSLFRSSRLPLQLWGCMSLAQCISRFLVASSSFILLLTHSSFSLRLLPHPLPLLRSLRATDSRKKQEKKVREERRKERRSRQTDGQRSERERKRDEAKRGKRCGDEISGPAIALLQQRDVDARE